MVSPVIEVYFDPKGSSGGKAGCFRSRLRDAHGLHDAAVTPADAVRYLVQNIVCHADYKEDGQLKYAHLSSNPDNYEKIRLDSSGKPMSGPWDQAEPNREGQVEDARQVASMVAFVMKPR